MPASRHGTTRRWRLNCPGRPPDRRPPNRPPARPAPARSALMRPPTRPGVQGFAMRSPLPPPAVAKLMSSASLRRSSRATDAIEGVTQWVSLRQFCCESLWQTASVLDCLLASLAASLWQVGPASRHGPKVSLDASGGMSRLSDLGRPKRDDLKLPLTCRMASPMANDRCVMASRMASGRCLMAKSMASGRCLMASPAARGCNDRGNGKSRAKSCHELAVGGGRVAITHSYLPQGLPSTSGRLPRDLP